MSDWEVTARASCAEIPAGGHGALRMVLDIRRQDPQRAGVVGAVGDLMGIHPEVLRHWVKKAEPETAGPAVASGEERVLTLEREVADLRRANAVLKAAAVLFASELQHDQAS